MMGLQGPHLSHQQISPTRELKEDFHLPLMLPIWQTIQLSLLGASDPAKLVLIKTTPLDPPILQ